MSAAEAIRAAEAAGVHLEIDGGDLVLKASAPPPTAVLDLLSRHKVGIVTIMRGEAVAQPIGTHPCARNTDTWPRAGLIPETGVGILTGPVSCGKNFLAVELARVRGDGKPFFGTTASARGGTAFLLSHGKANGFALRLAALRTDGPLPISATTFDDLSAPGALERLTDVLREESVRMDVLFGVPMRLVVIDPLELSGLLWASGGVAGAVALMDDLRAAAERLGLFILIVCMSPERESPWPERSAMVARADLVLRVVHHHGPFGELVAWTRSPASHRRLGVYQLKVVTIGHDNRGRPVTSCVASAMAPRRRSRRRPRTVSS